MFPDTAWAEKGEKNEKDPGRKEGGGQSCVFFGKLKKAII